ncbi:positive regulator of sigma(E), RseC/MucC [Magnetococcus marinus MC-1]|uniref:Positive regulator of sigma(E), RseC/MucC n=1 Tax=Magnetococcus marinus (strain ATCC BAA-1437 / JCM 17883 / MC-1) TaxID=156889 RepID=A0L8I7_MAGMM|nr:SoxR reducing system RseC family protein [Magnetococcus marinus]ABK44280.1 positive regulator of sigma(E), RseC/MucC [Magnetococcus marinus MC-1]
MMQEQGKVVELEGAFAIIATQRKSACGNCGGETSCNTLSGGLGKKPVLFRAYNEAQAKIGDNVVLEIREGAFLSASFLAYGMPMIALIVTGLVVRSIALGLGLELESAEGLGALSGLLALGGTFLFLRRFYAGQDIKPENMPVVRSILHPTHIPIFPTH